MGDCLFKKKRVLSTITALTLLFTLLLGNVTTEFEVNAETNSNNAVSDSYNLPENINEGAIIHAWCWSFNTIKNNIEDIAKAGYTAVQTSPINQCRIGNNGDLKFTNQWWYQYQPTNYEIGNYQLGTKEEFIEMCNEAHKYGVKVIVDLVINHMTVKWDEIDSSWQDESLFHGNTEISDWNNRYDVTQNALLSLWDLNTQNKEVQNKIKAYLSECIQCGADGFRYDAAKHVELPDDEGFSSDFWPSILNNGAKFQYGEILQDSISRDSAYGAIMPVTASSYGYKLRDAIRSNNFNAENIQNYNINVGANSLVTWVESHDNFTSDSSTGGYSSWMNDWQIKMCWAVIAARSGETPLFFSRPVGGGNGVIFTEETQIGDKGSDLFKDSDIVAVNKFRNAMVGESEYLKNYLGNDCLIIQRGNKGEVIINLGAAKTVDTDTNLQDGKYTDEISGKVFTVANGKLEGFIESRQIAVLYKPALSEVAKVYLKKPDTWNSPRVYVYDDVDGEVKELAPWPGIEMNYEDEGIYSYTLPQGYGNSKVIFNDGINQIPEAKEEGFQVVQGKSMIYDQGNFQEYKGVELALDKLLIDKQSPQKLGETMVVEADGNGGSGALQYKFSVSDSINDITVLKDYSTESVIQWTPPKVGDYTLIVTVKDENNTVKTIDMNYKIINKDQDSTIVYFKKPANWSTVRIYVYEENSNGLIKNSEWPGENMQYTGNDLYLYVVPKEFTEAKVLFNDGKNQIPAANEGGLSIKSGENKGYIDGNFDIYQ